MLAAFIAIGMLLFPEPLSEKSSGMCIAMCICRHIHTRLHLYFFCISVSVSIPYIENHSYFDTANSSPIPQDQFWFSPFPVCNALLLQWKTWTLPCTNAVPPCPTQVLTPCTQQSFHIDTLPTLLGLWYSCLDHFFPKFTFPPTMYLGSSCSSFLPVFGVLAVE